jgi:hypothetical protein
MVMEGGMFMIRLTGIIELAVPISKFHHEQVTMCSRPSSVTYTNNNNNLKYPFISDIPCCLSLMRVYLRLLLFVLYVTDEGVFKIITLLVVCH